MNKYSMWHPALLVYLDLIQNGVRLHPSEGLMYLEAMKEAFDHKIDDLIDCQVDHIQVEHGMSRRMAAFQLVGNFLKKGWR